MAETRELTQQIKDKAHQLGFDLVGVTTPDPPLHLEVYRAWVKNDRNGEMDYLEGEKAYKRRADPREILAECKSVLVLGLPYSNPDSKASDSSGHGRIAAYAWGEDYHQVLSERLEAIVEFIEHEVGHPVPNRWYTDTGPILEREFAQRAGFGWIGRNTMLINPEKGSYFFLAEILLGIELEPDQPLETDHCGSCKRCIEACPTECILPDRTLDASRCISYLTIELKGRIPADLRPQMGDWIFGCDVCQAVCPWNERFALASGDPSFLPRVGHDIVELESELRLSVEKFNRKFQNSPVKRAKRRGYLRNVAVALGNEGDASRVPALRRALLAETEPLVRGHAAWALGAIGGDAAIAALREALENEREGTVVEEIHSALGEAGG
ncbi:MAG: tRNA epoxyqueuosine(34) reductase QueG [Anaerolineales bacterium]